MNEKFQPPKRKRTIVGWRQVERRRQEIRTKHRPPPVPLKPEA
jgi:hypothetical protein